MHIKHGSENDTLVVKAAEVGQTILKVIYIYPFVLYMYRKNYYATYMHHVCMMLQMKFGAKYLSLCSIFNVFLDICTCTCRFGTKEIPG